MTTIEKKLKNFKIKDLNKNIGSVKTQPKSIAGQSFKLYPLSDIDELVKDGNYKKMRYLITIDGQIILAREGRPSKNIPTHFQMTKKRNISEAECLVAGNIKVDKDNKICFISNKSGDFEPAPARITWMISALLEHHNEKLADNIEIELQGLEEGIQKEILTKDQLKNSFNSDTYEHCSDVLKKAKCFFNQTETIEPENTEAQKPRKTQQQKADLFVDVDDILSGAQPFVEDQRLKNENVQGNQKNNTRPVTGGTFEMEGGSFKNLTVVNKTNLSTKITGTTSSEKFRLFTTGASPSTELKDNVGSEFAGMIAESAEEFPAGARDPFTNSTSTTQPTTFNFANICLFPGSSGAEKPGKQNQSTSSASRQLFGDNERKRDRNDGSGDEKHNQPNKKPCP